MKNRTFLAIVADWLSAASAATAQIAETGGTLTGSVSNAGTRNMLEGAGQTISKAA